MDYKMNDFFIEMFSKKIKVKSYEYENSRYNLVFLHEGLGSIKLWRKFPEILSKRLNLSTTVFDRFGHGESEKRFYQKDFNYLHDEAYKYLDILIKRLKLKNIILLGHSDGATISLLYAAKYNKNIKAVISIAAHVFVEDFQIDGLLDAKKAYENGTLYEKLYKYHGDKTDELFYSWNDIWLDKDFKKWNIFEELENIKVPVLIIQGSNDRYGSIRQVDLIYDNVKGPKEKIVIDNCGHSPHLEKEEVVLNEIARFIKNLS